MSLVEWRNDLTDLGRVLPILGLSVEVEYSDWNDDDGGNQERFAFLFYVAIIAPRDEPVASRSVGKRSARHAER